MSTPSCPQGTERSVRSGVSFPTVQTPTGVVATSAPECYSGPCWEVGGTLVFQIEGSSRTQLASETAACAPTAERSPSPKKGRRERRLRKDRKTDRQLDVRPRRPQA